MEFLIKEAELLEGAIGTGRDPIVKTITGDSVSWRYKGFYIYISKVGDKYGWYVDTPYVMYHGENKKPQFSSEQEAEASAVEWLAKNWSRFN